MDNQAIIVKNLVRVREANGLSQADLARCCDLSAEEIMEIEHNKQSISPDILIRIAEAFKYNPCDLLLYISGER